MPELSHIKTLVARGEQDAAIMELVRLLRSDPDNVEAWLLLADLREDPQERKDCYRHVLKIDPYNERAQAQMRVLGGTSNLEFNRGDLRRGGLPTAPAETSPDQAGGSGNRMPGSSGPAASLPGVIRIPEDPSARPVPPMSSSAEAPESMLRALRSELAPQPEAGEALEGNPSAPVGQAPSRQERVQALLAKIKPLPGRFWRYTRQHRPVQFLLIALGVILALALFLVLWSGLIPVQPPATLITGPAKKYIPDPAALPQGFSLLDTPAGNALISLPDKGEGYRMVFTNPGFAAQHRETSVSYEVVVFNNDVDAQVTLLSAADPQSYSAAGRIMETEAVSPNQVARVDATALLFGSKDQTLQGNPAISYTLLLREGNLYARVTVNAPVPDAKSPQVQKLRGPLYQAVFYYASLLTGKLPLPPSGQVTVSPPAFPVAP